MSVYNVKTFINIQLASGSRWNISLKHLLGGGINIRTLNNLENKYIPTGYRYIVWK